MYSYRDQSHSFSKLPFQISIIDKGQNGKNNRTSVYNDPVSQKWSVAEMKKGNWKAQVVLTRMYWSTVL